MGKWKVDAEAMRQRDDAPRDPTGEIAKTIFEIRGDGTIVREIDGRRTEGVYRVLPSTEFINIEIQLGGRTEKMRFAVQDDGSLHWTTLGDEVIPLRRVQG